MGRDGLRRSQVALDFALLRCRRLVVAGNKEPWAILIVDTVSVLSVDR
jgi:hypothetical protein